MARKLSNKTNVEAPSPTYPFGRVKDNPGDNTGTPVDENLVGDMIQFFEKIMSEAGITFNNQPENSSAGFQFFNALINNIRATAATESARGTVERATQLEVDNGIESTRYITPSTLSNYVNNDWIDLVIDPTLAPSSNFDPQYRVNRSGVLDIRGEFASQDFPDNGDDRFMFNLPAGARPNVVTYIPCVMQTNGTDRKVVILIFESNGDVSLYNSVDGQATLHFDSVTVNLTS